MTTTDANYIELHCHSFYSLLDGASSPEALVEEAARLGMSALALIDHDAVYGAVRFTQAAEQYHIHPIFGAELTLDEGAHLTLLVEDNTGWHNLCWLISQARQNAPKGSASLPSSLLEGHTDGLIALTGCRSSAIVTALLKGDWEAARASARQYSALFGSNRLWIELQHHLLPTDEWLIERQIALAHEMGLGYVATNNVHYATRDGHRLQDVLVCIGQNVTLDEAGRLRRPNSEYYLKSNRQMAPLFSRYPEALRNTLRIAERCQFVLRYGVQDLPSFPTPDGMSATSHLRRLCVQALPRWYASPPDPVKQRLEHELAVIEQGRLANYFLIVWDIVQYAHTHRILCQGRGSAACSLVAYLLGITPIDPVEHGLVFERFLSPERQLPPDIDLDIDAARRGEVIQYVYRRYGTTHAAMACTFITFRARSALRDVGKVLGLPLHLLEQASRALDLRTPDENTMEQAIGEGYQSPVWQQVLDLCRQIDGYPRHLGIHNGAMVIMGPPLIEHVPTEPATMPGRMVVQWDKMELEAVGLVKIDLLGLRMLSAVAEAVDLVEQQTGQRPDLNSLRFDDPALYAMLSRADTIGVFQVESRAQSMLLPRLKPKSFLDLIIAISLIRPGPIQGNMVHPFLRRRDGLEPVSYAHPRLENALSETLGVVVYQEQVLMVARDLAGFTGGQGELLRRALGSKRSEEAVATFRTSFIEGAQRKGVPVTIAEEVFEALVAFGSYSFPKSHAAAFATLVYKSAWLKRNWLAALLVGLLNNQPMGFWSPSVLIHDAERHGVTVLPVDIVASEARCILEGKHVRLGFNYVKSVGESGATRLIKARAESVFVDLRDLCRRTRLPPRIVENLILSGAFDRWRIPRRKLVWELGKLSYPVDELNLSYPDDDISLPELEAGEKLAFEYSVMGLSTDTHAVSLYRSWLTEHNVLTSTEFRRCKTGQLITIAGQIVVHQAPPTAKGVHFIALEDEDGLVDVVVKPPIYAQYRRIIRESSLLMVRGVVQRSGGAVSLLAQQVRSVVSPC